MCNVGSFCFAQLAASDIQKNTTQGDTQRHRSIEPDVGYDVVGLNDDTTATVYDGTTTEGPATTTHGTFKDKFKGFVKNVKDGAAEAYEAVSDSVSEVAHDINEKRKDAVAGTKQLVNKAIGKIKNSFKKDSAEEDVPRSSTEHYQRSEVMSSSEENDPPETISLTDDVNAFLQTEKKQ